jgi:hypothetical protein
LNKKTAPKDAQFLFSSRQWEAVKWRWAFIRLDNKYQEDFKRWQNTGRDIVIAAKWGLRELIDPKLTFEDICKEYETPEYANVSKSKKEYWIIEKLGGLEFDFIGIGITPLEDVRLSKSYDWDEIKRDHLNANAIILIIDITLPDSQIEAEVMEWVKKYRALKDIPLKKSMEKLQPSKYPQYLEIWKLNQQGYTHEEIADQLFLDEEELESISVKISRNLKSIKNFIGGPYRKRRTRND